MIILIPLGGLGTRFKNLGYLLPKPLINVMGKPILFWLLDNLNLQDISMVYIPYHPDIAKYRIEDRLQKNYTNINFKFLKLQENTRGAAETIHIALKKLEIDDEPILCLDGDNFYISDIVKLWNGENSIGVFEDISSEVIYSYVKVNDNNKILEIKEKNKISNIACTGAYGFNSWKTLNQYC